MKHNGMGIIKSAMIGMAVGTAVTALRPAGIAEIDGEVKPLFTWDTLSDDEEYVRFLRAMVSSFVEHMKARGDDDRCYYHISDEPSIRALDHYRACKESVAPYLEGYPIIDALSELEFYTSGAIDKPVPNTRSALKFHEAGIPGLWTYYCGGGKEGGDHW